MSDATMATSKCGPMLDYEEFKKEDLDYQKTKENVLGHGTFATVYKVKLAKYDGKPAAMKKLTQFKDFELQDNQLGEDVRREAKTMAKLRHENVVQVYGIVMCHEDGLYGILMEYMQCRSVLDLIKNENVCIEWPLRMRMLDQVTCGLWFLHSDQPGRKAVHHGDIKAENILVNARLDAKVSDFGTLRLKEMTAKKTGRSSTKMMGTITHTPAEVHCAANFCTQKADVWSLGVAMYQVTGRDPYPHEQEYIHKFPYRLIEKLKNKEVHPVDKTDLDRHGPQEFRDIMHKCLDYDPEKRPSLKEIHHKMKLYLEKSNGQPVRDALSKAHKDVKKCYFEDKGLPVPDYVAGNFSEDEPDTEIPSLGGIAPHPESDIESTSYSMPQPMDDLSKITDVVKDTRKRYEDELEAIHIQMEGLRQQVKEFSAMEKPVNVNVSIHAAGNISAVNAAAVNQIDMANQKESPGDGGIDVDMAKHTDEPTFTPAQPPLSPAKAALQSVWADMVQDLIVDDITPHLIQNNVISFDQDEKIRSYATRKEKAEALLHMIIKRPDEDIINHLCNALNETLQQHLAAKITNAHTSLIEKHLTKDV